MDTGISYEIDQLAHHTGIDREDLVRAHASIVAAGYPAWGHALDDWEALWMLRSVLRTELQVRTASSDFDIAALAQRLQEPKSQRPRSFKDGLRRQWWDR